MGCNFQGCILKVRQQARQHARADAGHQNGQTEIAGSIGQQDRHGDAMRALLQLVMRNGVTLRAHFFDTRGDHHGIRRFGRPRDHLLGLGYRDLTAIDLSATALKTVRDRLGAAGANVRLELADVLDLPGTRRYALWHDRAVFHFLTEQDERDDYRASLARCLDPGGWLVVATFGPDGPLTCSGLPIVRYSHEQLTAEFPDFELMATSGEDHQTSWGATQQFTAVLLRRRS